MKLPNTEDRWRRRAYSVFIPLAAALGLGIIFLAFKAADRERLVWEKGRGDELRRSTDAALERAGRFLADIEARAATEAARTPSGKSDAQFSPQDFADVRDKLLDVFIVKPPHSPVSIFFKPLYSDNELREYPISPALTASPDFRRAEDLEFRKRAPRAAARLYESLLGQGRTAGDKARVMNRIARCFRKAGEVDRASAIYARLASEYGHEPSEDSLPLGVLARLDQAALDESANRRPGAVEGYLDAAERLLDGDTPVTRSAFDLLFDTALTGCGRLREALPEPARDAAKRRMDALSARRHTREDETAILQAERSFAGGGEPASGAKPSRQETRVVADTFYSVRYLTLPGGPTIGLLIDIPKLAEAALAEPPGRASLSSGRMLEIADGTGRILARSGAEKEKTGEADLTVPFPDPLPPLVLRASLAPDSRGESGYALRKTLYVLIAFLVASALIAGGLMSIRATAKQMELARLKSDFVSTVSHELRTPLTSIRYLVELLDAGRVTEPEKIRKYYATLGRESERLSRLIENILDFSRIEAGVKDYRFKEADIAALTDTIVSRFRDHGLPEGFQLEAEVRGPFPAARLDPEAISQALANLLDNAAKYSGTATTIGLRAWADDAGIHWGVRDRGIGIAEEDRTRVFEKFYRAPTVAGGDIQGSGIGLTIVKHTADRHGGRVDIADAPGGGTIVTLTVPAADGAARERS